jgi:hypothetical protein
MDEIVARAMAKWPNVPFAYGWLALDGRGRWLLKGDPITNPGVVDFIGRNYSADERGRWHFQNGPQRVFVTLAVAPWILHLDGDGSLVTHTGVPAGAVREAWLDETGQVILVTTVGLCALIDRDLGVLVQCLQDAAARPLDDAAISAWADGRAEDPWLALGRTRVRIAHTTRATQFGRFGIASDPRPDPGEPEC